MELNFRQNQRGSGIAEFKDRYDRECSIQYSSLATEEAIWLGRDEGLHVEGDCLARMHLTREMAGVLGLTLLKFASTGELD